MLWVNSNFILSQKNLKLPAKKNSQRVKLSIPQTTHRNPILLNVVTSVNIAIIAVQEAAPSEIGIVL